MPLEASPATASPASSPTASGRKNPWIKKRANSGATSPVWRTWSNTPPPLEASGESLSTRVGSTATDTASAASSHSRSRLSDLPISPRNIAAPGQLQEDVLEPPRLRDKGAHGHAGADQRGVDRCGGRWRGDAQPQHAV